MDRNDSNPGMVERQMDETPMEGRSVESDRSGTERERDGMGGMDRDSLQRDSPSNARGCRAAPSSASRCTTAAAVERESMSR